MLAQPGSTQYDLRFRLMGVPVRVHPFFWLVGLMLGARLDDGRLILIWVVVVFASVLVHEMGHALASKWQRLRPSVVLYGMGGLCYSDRERLPLPGRLAIILAGPGAGLLLAALAMALAFVAGGATPIDSLAMFGVGPGDPGRVGSWLSFNSYLINTFFFVLFINAFWSLVNLLPVWPLDGGQFTGEVLGHRDPRAGMRQTHAVSMVTAGAVALWMGSRGDWFPAIFFAVFAITNYQALQLLKQGAFGSAFDDPADWWRR